MIKKLLVQNFQSHEESELELHPGVNILSGQSDSGKTALLRALDWALNNKPQGDDFRREGSDTTEVHVDMDTHLVKRWKRKTVDNCYGLLDKAEADDEDGGYEEFKAFGASVPGDIAEAVNMMAINWQRQLDAPFLLSNTSGEVARMLNQIVRLDVIDTALSRISAMVRDNAADARTAEGTLKRLEQDEEGFAYLDGLEPQVEEVEQKFFRKSELTAASNRLKGAMDEIQSARDQKQRATKTLEAEDLLLEIEALAEVRHGAEIRERKLTEIGRAVKRHREAIRMTRGATECEGDVRGLESLIKRQEEQQRAEERLSELITDIYKTESWLKELKKQIKPLEKQLEGTCPRCGRPLK